MAKKTKNTAELTNRPMEVTFSKAHLTMRFASPKDALAWQVNEQKLWPLMAENSSITHNYALASRNNLKLIQRDMSDAGSDEWLSFFSNIMNNYIPWQGAVGSLLSDLLERDANSAALAFTEIANPGSVGTNANNPVQGLEPRIYATCFRLFGSPPDLVRQIQDDHTLMSDARAQAEMIRNERAEDRVAFKEFLDKLQIDWENKIAGYEAKVALNAPREYWFKRSENHTNRAAELNKKWIWSLVGVLSSVIGLMLLSYAPFANSVFGRDVIVDGIKRAFIFGTLLSFGVWWLRQILRDLRSHEHLATDAAERVTMIETYAAMRGAGLESDNLALILGALYRPASTGIIDDTGPVLPLELVLKGLGERGK